MKNNNKKVNDKIRKMLVLGKSKYNIQDAAIDYYILLCGLFPPSRSIFLNWHINMDLFKVYGINKEYLLQAIILYLTRKYQDEMSEYAG